MNVKVDDFLARAVAEPVELTIGDLLAIWGYRARNYESVARIQHDLSASGLRCHPALDEGASDSVVRVGVPDATSADDTAATESGSEDPDEPLVLPPAALLVKQVPSAVRDVVFVQPDQSLAQAQSLMSANDFSQLPVFAGPAISGARSAGGLSRRPSATRRRSRSRTPPRTHRSSPLATSCSARSTPSTRLTSSSCGTTTTASAASSRPPT